MPVTDPIIFFVKRCYMGVSKPLRYDTKWDGKTCIHWYGKNASDNAICA